jgi:hypothetical protein
MKKKLLSLASLLAVLNIHAIEIGPTGSGIDMSGFIDIQASKQGDDTETTGAQVELNFGYQAGPVSAAVGFDFGEISTFGDSTSNNNLEEAYVTYDFGNGFSATAGRMLSYMGFEAFDPTNMYQFSYAYDVTGTQDIYDNYDTGLSIDYGNDSFSVGIWSSMENEAGYELALAFTGIENLTAKAIWSDFSNVTPSASADPYEKSTFWISYELGKLLLAAEVADKDSQGNGSNGHDVEGLLLMANYSASDKFAMTFRYSETEYTSYNGNTVLYDGSKLTFSPSYAFTDSLSGLLEYSTYSRDSGSIAEPEELIAAELIFTF